MPPSDTPSYVIVMQSHDGARAEIDLVCHDDVHAIVAARRLFVQEIVTTQRHPLSLTLGRNGADGQVLWLSTWSSSPAAAALWRGDRTASPRRRASAASASRRAAGDR